MTNSSPLSKEKQVSTWVQKIRKSSANVLVSNYCYECAFSKKSKTKTLIAFPDQIGEQGIISIDKPLEEVEIFDIIKLYKKIKCS